MTKAALIALTAVVWTGGFAATGALVRIVHHPVAPPPSITYVDTTPAPVALVAQAAQPVEENIIVLPTVEIVASLPRAIPQPKPQPTHELHCRPWKPLEQGSGGVQVCD